MFGVFNWLRAQAKQAVLGGVADALEELSPENQPADLDRLRALLAGEARALPAAKGVAVADAPTVPAPTTTDAPAPATEPEPATSGTGKRKK